MPPSTRRVSLLARQDADLLDYGDDADRAEKAENELLRTERERRRISQTLKQQRRQSRLSRAHPDNTVTDMYDRCIKLSAENKINRKNTWDLTLIDHIHDVIGDSGANTNFQKASCTLDASVKIYSYRVDSVHHDMFKVLGGLNRSDQNENGEEAPQDGEEEGLPEPNRVRRRRQNLNSCLETRPASLCTPLAELLLEVDPMFQRTASSFDEGGAKGLLLNQLSVGQGCNIVFDFSTGVHDPSRDDASLSTSVDISSCIPVDLPNQISSLTSTLRSRLVSPISSIDDHTAANNVIVDDHIDTGYNHYDFDEEDYDDEGAPVDCAAFDLIDPLPDDYDGQSDSLDNMEDAGGNDHPNGVVSGGESRRFSSLFPEMSPSFNQQLTLNNRNWAGPGLGITHWKFKADSQKEDIEIKALSVKLRKTKVSNLLDLRAPPINREEFCDPVRGSNTMSEVSISRNDKVLHLLPSDLHIQPSVLNRLFSRSHFMMAPASKGAEDALGGDMRLDQYDDDGDNFTPSDDDGADPPQEVGRAAFSSEFEFVKQPSTTDKVEIDFAKAAKKVDIKAVKNSLWRNLSEKIQMAPMITIEQCDKIALESSDENGCDDVSVQPVWPSFKEAVETLPVPESSRDAMSIQLYFICLLHLANENDLMLKPGKVPLHDFSVARRAPHGSSD